MISNQSTTGCAAEDVLVVRDAQTDADAVIGESVEAICGHSQNLDGDEKAKGPRVTRPFRAGVKLVRHLGAVGSAAALALAAVLAFAAVVAALAAALALAVVFAFTGVLGGFGEIDAGERQLARLQNGRCGRVECCDACINVTPLSRPDTAAATIMVFKDCFICHSSIGFRGPDQARLGDTGERRAGDLAVRIRLHNRIRLALLHRIVFSCHLPDFTQELDDARRGRTCRLACASPITRGTQGRMAHLWRIRHEDARRAAVALRFVLMIGVVSFFADFVYEGVAQHHRPVPCHARCERRHRRRRGRPRRAAGLRAALLFRPAQRADPPVLADDDLRLLRADGRRARRSRWPATGRSPSVLIVLERVGKAIRNPPRDVMLSHAGKEMGIGWAFGLHEGLDQAGALIGPLVMALILARRGEYRICAFATLLIPAVITAVLIVVTKFLYPRPEDLEPHSPAIHATGLGRAFWIYLVGAALVAAGFADYQLIAFHLQKHGIASAIWIPIFYSVAMATSGAGSLLFGQTVRPLRRGGAHPAHVYFHCVGAVGFSGRIHTGRWSARRCGGWAWACTSRSSRRRWRPWCRRSGGLRRMACSPPRYGIFWFLGSAAIGFLYDVSVAGAVVCSAWPPAWRRCRFSLR